MALVADPCGVGDRARCGGWPVGARGCRGGDRIHCVARRQRLDSMPGNGRILANLALLLPLQRPAKIQSELRRVSIASDSDRKNGARAVSSEERIDHLQQD